MKNKRISSLPNDRLSKRKRKAFVKLLKFCEEQNIFKHHWTHDDVLGWHLPPAAFKSQHLGSLATTAQIKDASKKDLAAVCFEITKWLRDKHKVHIDRDIEGWWICVCGDRQVLHWLISNVKDEASALLEAAQMQANKNK